MLKKTKDIIAEKVFWSEIENFNPVLDQSLIPFGSEQDLLNLKNEFLSTVNIKKYKMPTGFMCNYSSKFYNSNIHNDVLYSPSFYNKLSPEAKKLGSTIKNLDKVLPTMSLRTLWCEDAGSTFFAKFSIKKKISGLCRVLSRHEAYYSIYASDSLRENWNSKVMYPIWDNMVIDYPGDLTYRCLIRSDEYLYRTSNVLPLANFCKLINLQYIEKSAIWRFEKIFKDILLVLFQEIKQYYENGISLEIHGQNLLVGIHSKEKLDWTGEFFYRDFGNIGLSREIWQSKKILSSTEANKISLWPCTSNNFIHWQFGKTLANDILSSIIYSITSCGDKKDLSRTKVYDEYRNLVNRNFSECFHI